MEEWLANSPSNLAKRETANALGIGCAGPPPFGSSQRTILVRLDPNKLRSYNMSPDLMLKGAPQ